jgi:hypothetical protein
MSIPQPPTMPLPDLPTSQGERRIRPLQKLFLIILIATLIVLVGGGALLYYLAKSREAGTQVARSTPSSSRVVTSLRHLDKPHVAVICVEASLEGQPRGGHRPQPELPSGSCLGCDSVVDLIPHFDSRSFGKCFHRFVCFS